MKLYIGKMKETEYLGAKIRIKREREKERDYDLMVRLPNLIMSAMIVFCPLCPPNHDHGTVPHVV